ncbi:hypothetical protein ATCC90586_005292 [Pythium insidiosum]|nr:hypothetical protein ATCC90586_005292 [Pythium insidiosum]
MGANNSIPADEMPGGPMHQTRLLYRNTWRVDSANRLFGACYDGNTVVIINPGRSPVKPYIRVPEGTYALVQNQGRDVDYVGPGGKRSAVWPPGFHFASPFTKVAHLVTKQYIVFDTPVKGCKTADDVTVAIDICLVLRIMGDETKGEDPELVRRFVYELGPNGLENVVVSGDTSGSLLADMMVANRQQSVLVNVDGLGKRDTGSSFSLMKS